MQPPPIQQKISEQSGQVDSIWARWFIAMKTAIESASQAVALRWGAITGTLSEQKDLQAALDAKADTTALSGLATTDFVTGVLKGIGADFVKPVDDQNQTFHYADDTGAANAYAVTLSPAVSAYVAGLRVAVKIANANTTASTLAVNGLTATAIKKESSSGLVDLAAGDLQAGGIYVFTYDGTVFQLAAGGFSNPMTTLGDTLYEDATPAAARLPGNTTSTKKFLTQTGTGSVSAAPGWNTIAQADVPAFTGDSGSGGTLGGVPAPAAGDAAANKFLKADATWAVAGSGTVTTTGTPASGELAKFSGASSITNGNLSGDVTTNNTLATEVVGILNKAIDGTAWADGQVLQYQSSPDKVELVYIPRQFLGGMPGAPSGGQELLLASISFPTTFPANFANSYGSIGPNGANPASTATLTVKKTSGGVVSTIGTISVSTSGVFTFATTGGAAQSLGSGDLLSVVNQSPADSTLSSPSFVLVGYLGSTSPSNPISGGGNVSGPGSSTNNDFVMFNGTSGNVLKDNGLALDTDGTLAADSDSKVPSQKAVKTYVDGKGQSGLILLEQHTAAGSAELDFTSCISSAYDDYVIRFVSLVAASGTPVLLLQVHTVSGYDTTAAHYGALDFFIRIGSTATGSQIQSTAGVYLGGNNASAPGVSGVLNMFAPGSSDVKVMMGDSIALNTDGNYYKFSLAANFNQTAAVDGFRVLFNGVNIASGTVRVYGVAK